MSRIGRLPIPVPKGVDVRLEANNQVTVKGPKGSLTQAFHPDLQIVQEDGTLKVQRNPDCPLCGDHPSVTELIDYEQFCGFPGGGEHEHTHEESLALA